MIINPDSTFITSFPHVERRTGALQDIDYILIFTCEAEIDFVFSFCNWMFKTGILQHKGTIVTGHTGKTPPPPTIITKFRGDVRFDKFVLQISGSPVGKVVDC